MAALHPFLMHQPGVPHSVPSQVPQSHMGHFSSLPTISSIQPWQTEQVTDINIFVFFFFSSLNIVGSKLNIMHLLKIVSEGSNVSVQNELQSSQNVQSIMTSNANYPYEMTDNGQALEPDYLDVHSRERREPDSGISLSSGETQVF